MKNKKKAFTIAELVVIIVILWILTTLWFVSFSGYSSWVRDSNRISQITWISNNLNIYKIKNLLPLPDQHILLEVNGEDIWYQWYAWKDLLEKIDYKKWGFDPKDDKYYTYYLTKDKTNFQLLAFLSKDKSISGINIWWDVYSDFVDYSDRTPYVEGKRLWILLESKTNTPIQELNWLLLTKRLDLWLTNNFYKTILNNDDYLEWTWAILADLKIASLVWWKWCTWKSWTIVCWKINTIIVWDDIFWRKWTNWNIWLTCDSYKNPSSWYIYSWDIWDWIYWVNPTWSSAFMLYCDMTS